MAFGAGGVDSGVQSTEPRDRSIDQFSDIVLAANVSTDEHGFGAELA